MSPGGTPAAPSPALPMLGAAGLRAAAGVPPRAAACPSVCICACVCLCLCVHAYV